MGIGDGLIAGGIASSAACLYKGVVKKGHYTPSHLGASEVREGTLVVSVSLNTAVEAVVYGSLLRTGFAFPHKGN